MEYIIVMTVSLAVGIVSGYFLFGHRKEAPFVGSILADWAPEHEYPSLITELEPDGMEQIMRNRTVQFHVRIN